MTDEKDFLETAAKRTFIVVIAPKLFSRTGYQTSTAVVKSTSVDKARKEAFRRIKTKRWKHLNINTVVFTVEEVTNE